MKLDLHPTYEKYNNILEILDTNLYCFLRADSQETLVEYINNHYCATKLGEISRELAVLINAHVVSVSEYNFDPYGSSTNTLISIPVQHQIQTDECVIAHLDKSHISIHTYIDFYDMNTAFLRLDLCISTCGVDSPLDTIQFLLDKFSPQVAFFEYRLRGFNLKNKNAIKEKEMTGNFKSKIIAQQKNLIVQEVVKSDAHFYQVKFLQKEIAAKDNYINRDIKNNEDYNLLLDLMENVYNSIYLV